MKNIFKLFFPVLAVLFTVTGCDNTSLEDLSKDPNNPTSVSSNLLFTAAEAQILGRFGSNWDRYAGTFIQTFAGNHATGVSADQYEINSSFETATYERFYRGGMKDAYELIKSATEKEEWHHVGGAQVLMALALGHLTDIYGDLPYSEAFQGAAVPYPMYDSQENIYNEIFDLLTDAVANFDKSSSVTIGSEDFVYGGDLSKWKGLANMLLARYNNHLSQLDPSGSATKSLAAVDAALAAGFTSNGGNLKFPYDGTTDWQNPWFSLFQNNLIIASKKFMDLLISTNDPRKLAYWNDTDVNGDVVGYVGKPNGSPINANFSPVGPKTYYGRAESPELIATYFELKFIEAEAAFRSGDLGRAATAHNDAIKAQIDLVTPFILNGLTGTDKTNYQSQIGNYKSNFASETSGTISIEKIMTEKWKAMFTMNVESWVDVRRHDYAIPTLLELPLNAKLTDFIGRGIYPESVRSRNANTPRDVKIGDKLWWDK